MFASFKKSALGALALTAALSLPCQAAVLEAVQGKIFVNRGDGFKATNGPQPLKSGDRVMAEIGGSAIVKYTADCAMLVQAGAVVTVVPDAQCVSQSHMVQTGGSLKDSLPAPGSAGAPPPATAAAAPLAFNPLVAGAIVVGAGAAIYFATRPSSP
jgi:hypothetical protein